MAVLTPARRYALTTGLLCFAAFATVLVAVAYVRIGDVHWVALTFWLLLVLTLAALVAERAFWQRGAAPAVVTTLAGLAGLGCAVMLTLLLMRWMA